MSEAELRLFTALVGCAERYLEFGSGGSTVFAAGCVRGAILSVDSSADWSARVAQACQAAGHAVQPVLRHVDIGPTGDWGAPLDDQARPRWPEYHRAVWDEAAAQLADLIMIDGRFRVACCMQAVLRGDPGAVILFHDFASRPHYHVIHEVMREIARVEDLSVFRVRPGARARAAEILARYAFEPA